MFGQTNVRMGQPSFGVVIGLKCDSFSVQMSYQLKNARQNDFTLPVAHTSHSPEIFQDQSGREGVSFSDFKASAIGFL